MAISTPGCVRPPPPPRPHSSFSWMPSSACLSSPSAPAASFVLALALGSCTEVDESGLLLSVEEVMVVEPTDSLGVWNVGEDVTEWSVAATS